MTITTSPDTSPSPTDDLGPLHLPAHLRLRPEQDELLCAENREAVLELPDNWVA